MIGFFSKLIVGHFRQHRLEMALCLIGVALGVAVVVAIDSAVSACVESFSGAVNSLAERSTHSIFSEEGTISDEAYVGLLKKKLPFPLAPVMDRGVLIGGDGHADVLGRLIGVDVFSERSLRSFTKMQSSLDEVAFRQFLTEPGQIVLVDELARRLGVRPGADVRLTVGAEALGACCRHHSTERRGEVAVDEHYCCRPGDGAGIGRLDRQDRSD